MLVMKVLIVTFFILYILLHCSSNKLLETDGINMTIFNVVSYGGAIGDGKRDDSQAFLKTWSGACGMKNGIATFEVPSGKSFLLNPLQFRGPCNYVSLRFQLEGKVVAPDSTEAWRNLNSSIWIYFTNVDGLIISGGGQFDGRGSVWWSTCNVDRCPRPTALHIHSCSNLQLFGTRHLNSARNHITINESKNVKIFNLTITAPQNSPNTDGIDISQSSNVELHNITVATGDDCVSVKNGAKYVNITGVTCGPGHGISVGSLGANGAFETVEQVHVNNCSFIGADFGMRIKTWAGGSGYARNISFENIILTNTKLPIIIDQNYIDTIWETSVSSSVQISGVTYRDIHGTSASLTAISLNCSMGAGCTNIYLGNIDIKSTSGSMTNAYCNNAHGTAVSTSPNVSCLSK